MRNELHEPVVVDVMAKSRARCGGGGGATKEVIRQDLRARVLDVSSVQIVEFLKMMATSITGA